MKKTNHERAKSVLKWNAVKSSWENDDHRRLTVNGVDLLKDITAALDKAERRERRKGSVFYEVKPRPAPQFDAENVKQLIGNLMGSVYYKATINDWFVESQKRAAEIVENDKHALLAALGIDK